ncbi:MAG: hypothetical protein JXR53_08965 [Bacteroidales bacterium]|nr:hypothetical protein [Bacteroidales bacterium]
MIAKLKYLILSFFAKIIGGKKLRYRKLIAGIFLLYSASSMISCKPQIMCYSQPDPNWNGNDTISVNSTDTINPDDIPPRTCYKTVLPDYDTAQKTPTPPPTDQLEIE